MSSLLRHGDVRFVAREFKRRFYSEETAFGLVRDLTQPAPCPPARTELEVRPLQPEDVAKLFEMPKGLESEIGARERMRRLRLLEYDIPTCYVAVDAEGTPCYMQWLMGAEHNDRIQSFFDGSIPRLGDGEMVLENAFTHEAFRGRGVMPVAMWKVGEIARELGAQRAITFVEHSNIASLKGCERAGFAPYLLRSEVRRGFRRRTGFIRRCRRHGVAPRRSNRRATGPGVRALRWGA